MTREEAIDIIRQYECCNEHTEACEMAIKALKAEPVKRGKWEESPTGWIACSVCGNEPPEETNIPTDYCPNCGAKMEEELQATEHDGCEGCKYTHKDQYEMPCLMCKRSKRDDLWKECLRRMERR